MKRKLINWAKPIVKRLLGIETITPLEALKRRGLKVGADLNMQEGCIIEGFTLLSHRNWRQSYSCPKCAYSCA